MLAKRPVGESILTFLLRVHGFGGEPGAVRIAGQVFADRGLGGAPVDEG